MKEMINYAKVAEGWFKMKYPTLSQTDLMMACALCKEFRLNPMRNQVYFVNFGNQLTLVVSYQIIMARAMQDPRIYRWTISFWQNGEELLHPHLTFATCKGVVANVQIFNKEGNLISSVDWDVEDNATNCKGSFKNSNFNSWVQKCALTNAFRRTAPDLVQGLYVEEEFPAQSNASSEATEPKKASVSPLYRNVIAVMKNRGLDKGQQIKLIEAYQTESNKTHEDLVNGQFDVSDMMAFIDANTLTPEEVSNEQPNEANGEVH